jgi:hypothetical protein
MSLHECFGAGQYCITQVAVWDGLVHALSVVWLLVDLLALSFGVHMVISDEKWSSLSPLWMYTVVIP